MFRITGGLKAESGRLQHFSAGENDCGLRITKVEAKDDGVWACNVGVAEDGEVVYNSECYYHRLFFTDFC